MNKTKDEGKFFSIKKRSFKLFSFFLTAAFVFLLLSKLSESYTKQVKLNVELFNLDDEVLVYSDFLPEAAVNIKSKGFSLLQFLFNDSKTIRLDAKKDVSKFKNQFLWDLKSNSYKLDTVFGNSVEVLGVEPDTIRIAYSKLQTKMLPVELISDLNFSAGYDIVGDINISKDSVKVIGSENEIDSLNSIKTELLALEDIKENIDEILLLEASANYTVVPGKVNVKADVSVFTEGQISLPIEIVNAPLDKSINYFPKSVNVIYYIDVENFKSVIPQDFKVVADFSDMDFNKTKSLEVMVSEVPNTIKKYRLQQNRIQFIVSE